VQKTKKKKAQRISENCLLLLKAHRVYLEIARICVDQPCWKMKKKLEARWDRRWGKIRLKINLKHGGGQHKDEDS